METYKNAIKTLANDSPYTSVNIHLSRYFYQKAENTRDFSRADESASVEV
ncbi:hypothetical protein Q3E60_13465 [Enterococcus faecium]|nr:hypothetical protein [Enterococcus faecium]